MNKVTRFISAVSALMAISVSCAKQELPVSTFKMDSTAIVVPAGGGICSVPYQVASSDAGNAEVIRMAGEYTYDEEKGLIYLYDDSNTMEMYHKDVVISLKKDGRRYIFEIVETVQPEFWRPYLSNIMEKTGIDLMTEPNFGFTLSNYTQTEFYMPFGSFVYTLKVMD